MSAVRHQNFFSEVLVARRGLLVAPQAEKDGFGGARPTVFVILR